MPDLERPFTTFNFRVELERDDENTSVCDAYFSDCDGLELTMEPKTIRQGGDNGRQIHLVGPVSYGQLTLKRGMTSDMGLWRWFEAVQLDRALRASGSVTMLSSSREPSAVFLLTGCLPTKLRAPALNAKDGEVAIEEMQIVYETLTFEEQGD